LEEPEGPLAVRRCELRWPVASALSQRGQAILGNRGASAGHVRALVPRSSRVRKGWIGSSADIAGVRPSAGAVDRVNLAGSGQNGESSYKPSHGSEGTEDHDAAMSKIEEQESTVHQEQMSDEFEDMKLVARHFDAWQPTSATSMEEKLRFGRSELIQAVAEDSVLLACRLRGIEPAGRRKMQLIPELATAIRLELDRLGQDGYERMRLAELSIPSLQAHGQLGRASSIETRLRRIWIPLVSAFKQRVIERNATARRQIKARLLAMENRYV